MRFITTRSYPFLWPRWRWMKVLVEMTTLCAAWERPTNGCGKTNEKENHSSNVNNPSMLQTNQIYLWLNITKPNLHAFFPHLFQLMPLSKALQKQASRITVILKYGWGFWDGNTQLYLQHEQAKLTTECHTHKKKTYSKISNKLWENETFKFFKCQKNHPIHPITDHFTCIYLFQPTPK